MLPNQEENGWPVQFILLYFIFIGGIGFLLFYCNWLHLPSLRFSLVWFSRLKSTVLFQFLTNQCRYLFMYIYVVLIIASIEFLNFNVAEKVFECLWERGDVLKSQRNAKTFSMRLKCKIWWNQRVEHNGTREMLRSNISLISWLQPSNSLLHYAPKKFNVQSNNHNGPITWMHKSKLDLLDLGVVCFFFF